METDDVEKWIEIAATKPVLDLNSSFLEWEQALITGHPTHPVPALDSNTN